MKRDAAFDFSDLTLALKTGREVEFCYESRNYSITNSRGSWNLCEDTEVGSVLLQTLCSTAETAILAEKAGKIALGGMTVRRIFDEGCYTALCIL